MSNEGALLHIAFGPAVAGTLKEALAELGRPERVIYEPDDLGYGPINPHSPALRAEFGERLGCDNDASFVDQIDAFWTEATNTTATPVAWLSRRCVREYAGFLELVSRRDEPPLVVDVAKIDFIDSKGARVPDISGSMGYVSPKMLIENTLLGRATRMSDVELQQERARWRKLKDENADLRVLDATGLVSAPITFFDELIMPVVTHKWRVCAEVVARALVRTGNAFEQTSDRFLWSRLRTLVDEGVLEGRGDMLLMHESLVRRPAKR